VLLEFGAFSGLIGGTIGFFIEHFPGIEFFAVSIFIVTYHILSDFTSLKVRTKASQSVNNLLKLQPSTAKVLRNNKEEEIPVEELNISDLIRIRPGENIPVDGKVAEGSSSVDESIVTGESMPVEKQTGDEVIGGSMNKSGTMIVKVTHLGEEGFLQKVAHSIEEARALKPGIILLVDKILKYYVPGVLLFSGLSILIWTAGDFLLTGHIDIVRGIFAALAVFVMGYPCALGMATPLAMIYGGGKAAEKGIIIRSSIAFQALKDAKIIAFDKTGTITKGKPEVTDIIPADGVDKNHIIIAAASVEYLSEHPLAEAIVNYADKNNLSLSRAENFESYPGKGIKAFIGHNEILIGSLNFLETKSITISDNIRQISEKIEENSKTVTGVSENTKLIGIFAIADTIKEDAKDAIKELKNAGLEPIMITGDNKQTALSIAAQIGIEKVEAEVLPDKKLHKIRQLQNPDYKVIMVGDGINDAPALMQADVGIAIGTGTDIAIESADIIIMGDSLMSIPAVYHIGKNSYKKTVQNLTLAFIFNGVGVPLAVTGLVNPIWAMVAMVTSVSIVLINSFGISIFKSEKKHETLYHSPERKKIQIDHLCFHRL
ncbi:MAG TPA: heavy metal translocating P-type ATPase, partial [Bacteroidetes bacterium]|nr:heavy metal translocating P-type ATPase [Bacteroidota bacterium]